VPAANPARTRSRRLAHQLAEGAGARSSGSRSEKPSAPSIPWILGGVSSLVAAEFYLRRWVEGHSESMRPTPLRCRGRATAHLRCTCMARRELARQKVISRRRRFGGNPASIEPVFQAALAEMPPRQEVLLSRRAFSEAGSKAPQDGIADQDLGLTGKLQRRSPDGVTRPVFICRTGSLPYCLIGSAEQARNLRASSREGWGWRGH